MAANQGPSGGGDFLRVFGIIYLVKRIRQRRRERRERAAAAAAVDTGTGTGQPGQG
jgi:hypothetical protein